MTLDEYRNQIKGASTETGVATVAEPAPIAMPEIKAPVLPDHPTDHFSAIPDPNISSVQPDLINRAMKYQIGLGIPVSYTAMMGSTEAIDRKVAQSPAAMDRLNKVDSALKAVSTIGAYSLYANKDRSEAAKKMPPETVRIYAEAYRRAGILDDDDIKNYDFNKPLPAWAIPSPAFFYDDTTLEKIVEAVKGFSSGASSAAATLMAGLEMLNGRSWEQGGAKYISEWFDKEGFKDYDPKTGMVSKVKEWLKTGAEYAAPRRPDFFTDIAAGFGSMGFYALIGRGTGGVAARAGISRALSIQTTADFMSIFESVGNAGSVYEQSLQETGDKDRANKAADLALWANLPLNLTLNRLLFSSSKYSFIRGIKSEGTQEGSQSMIEDIALEKPVTLDKTLYSTLLGGIVGGGTAIFFDYAQTKINAIPPLTVENKTLYADTVKEKLAEGMSLDKAHVEATKAVGRTPDGAKTIMAVGEAMEAVIKAEASIGEDIEPEDLILPIPQEGKKLSPGEILDMAERLRLPKAEDAPVRIPTEEELDSILAESPANIKGTPEKLAAAVGKSHEIEFLKRRGIEDPADQIHQIVNDAVGGPAKAAQAFENRGDTEEAQRLRKQAEDAGRKLKAADGALTEAEVNMALGLAAGTAPTAPLTLANITEKSRAEWEAKQEADEISAMRNATYEDFAVQAEELEAQAMENQFAELEAIFLPDDVAIDIADNITEEDISTAIESVSSETTSEMSDDQLVEEVVNNMVEEWAQREIANEEKSTKGISNKTKSIINENTGVAKQKIVDMVREDVAFKEALTQAVRASKQGHKAGVKDTTAKFKAKIANMKAKSIEKAWKLKQKAFEYKQSVKEARTRSDYERLWQRLLSQQEARIKKEDARYNKEIKRVLEGKLGKIDVEFQKRIRDLMVDVAAFDITETIKLSDIQKSEMSQRTLDRLGAMAEWVKENAEYVDENGIKANVVMAPERLAEIERLSKIPLGRLTTKEKAAIAEQLNILKYLGMQKLLNKRIREADALQDDIDVASADVKNLDGIFKLFNEWYMENNYIPTALGYASKSRLYSGPLPKLAKKTMRAEYARERAKAFIKSSAMAEIKELGFDDKVDIETEERLTIHALYREGSIDAAAMLLMNKGIEIPTTGDGYIDEAKFLSIMPKLSDKESKVLDILEKYSKVLLPMKQAVYENRENKIFPTRERYIKPLKYVDDLQADVNMQDLVQHNDGRTSRTKQGFLIERVRSSGRLPSTAIFNDWVRGIDESANYVFMQPAIDQIAMITRGPQFTKASGKLVSNYIKNWIDMLSRNGWSTQAVNEFQASPIQTGYQRAFRTSLTAIFIGAKIPTTLVQPLSVLGGMAVAASNHGPTAMAYVGKGFTQSWLQPGFTARIKSESESIMKRADFGEYAIEDYMKELETYDISSRDDKILGVLPNIPKWLRKKLSGPTLSIIQYPDIKTASGVWAGFREYLVKQGMTEAEAKEEADFYMEMSQASSLTSLRPIALSKGEGARTWYTLSGWLMAQFGTLTYSVIHQGMTEKQFNIKANAILGMAMLILAGFTESEARRLYNTMMGRKQRKEENIIVETVLQLVQLIPKWGGILVSAYQRRPSGPPAVQMAGNVVQSLSTLATTKKRKTRTRAQTRLVENGMILLGLGFPSQSQVFDLIEMAQE